MHTLNTQTEIHTNTYNRLPIHNNIKEEKFYYNPLKILV